VDIASKRSVQPKSNFLARLIMAVFSLTLEEVAIYAIWRWILPEFNMGMQLYVLILTMVAWAAFAIGSFIAVTRALRRPQILGFPSMVGSVGEVVSPLAPDGLVRIRGELWIAVLDEGEKAEVAEEITVTDMDGLRLHVRRSGILQGADV
jgi:membrane-bound ClpP family serine protease